MRRFLEAGMGPRRGLDDMKTWAPGKGLRRRPVSSGPGLKTCGKGPVMSVRKRWAGGVWKGRFTGVDPGLQTGENGRKMSDVKAAGAAVASASELRRRW